MGAKCDIHGDILCSSDGWKCPTCELEKLELKYAALQRKNAKLRSATKAVLHFINTRMAAIKDLTEDVSAEIDKVLAIVSQQEIESE